jgi:hypothetical protein
VSRSAFDKYVQLYNRAKQLLRRKLIEAIVNREIADPPRTPRIDKQR